MSFITLASSSPRSSPCTALRRSLQTLPAPACRPARRRCNPSTRRARSLRRLPPVSVWRRPRRRALLPSDAGDWQSRGASLILRILADLRVPCQCLHVVGEVAAEYKIPIIDGYLSHRRATVLAELNAGDSVA